VTPFDLFKKKPRDIPPSRESISGPPSEIISIQKAQDLLQKLESTRVRELSIRLAAIKESAGESLKFIDVLAKDMDRENIKLEGLEEKLKSVVEHSKRTVVTSLKREASIGLPEPRSANDAKKFKERFEATMKRFGEVSGSHSKVLNAFMKKHSGKMKSEFEFLTKLLNETREILAEFETEREPIIKCNNLLNTALQKLSSIKLSEASAANIEKEIEDMSRELEKLESDLANVTASQEFVQANHTAREITLLKTQQEEFHEQVRDLFSHLSRAFGKYSYGLTKETEQHLQTMSDEPWEILYQDNIAQYSSLLLDIRRSIDSGNLQLKDSDKVIQYLDLILQSLPELKDKAELFKKEISLSRQHNLDIVYKVKSLQEKIVQQSDSLARSRQDLQEKRRQGKEKQEEVDLLMKEAGQTLSELTGQRYILEGH
jgi:hypothetical protein